MQFLRGDLSARKIPIRPPWSRNEAEFTGLCNRCGDCLPACPQHILVQGRGGFPQLDFSRSECLFCGDCSRACGSGALQADGSQPWNLQVVIADSCLAQRGVECRVCSEVCEAAAIRILLRVGGPGLPQVENERCNGCGACVGDCPVKAIEMQSMQFQENEQ